MVVEESYIKFNITTYAVDPIYFTIFFKNFNNILSSFRMKNIIRINPQNILPFTF